jgi:hypothetical protein
LLDESLLVMIDRKALDLVAVAGVAKNDVGVVVVVVVVAAVVVVVKFAALFALKAGSPSPISVEAAALADNGSDCWYNRGLDIITCCASTSSKMIFIFRMYYFFPTMHDA